MASLSKLSSARPAGLASVLPTEAGIVVCESSLLDEGEPLLPEELRVLQAFGSEKRRREFSAGRRCARSALARLGIHEFPLLPDHDRSPIWPSTVIGSITHTDAPDDGYCGVAVARRYPVRAIGIDAEPNTGLPEDLWDRVLDPTERRAALRFHDPGMYARLIFSAKEAVYKALYPMFKRFMDFPDIHIDCLLTHGVFSAELRGQARDLGVPGAKLLGRVVIVQTLIMTGLALTAGSLQSAQPGMLPQRGPSRDS